MLKTIAFCIACVAIGGCATPLGPDNSITISVASPHSSEQTFRNLLKVMKDCYPDSLTIRANYFPEAKEGEIDLYTANDFGNIPFGTWTVKPASAGSTVTQVRSTRTGKQLDATLPEWIDGNAQRCPHGTRSEPRPPGSELNQNHMPVR